MNENHLAMENTPLANWLDLVKKAAECKKITQAEISRKSGVSKSYICEIFSGKKEPRLSVVVSIFLSLGIVPIIDFQNENVENKG